MNDVNRLQEGIRAVNRDRRRCITVRSALISFLRADRSIERLAQVSEGGMTSWTYVRGEHRFVLRVSDPGLRPDLEELHQLMVDNLHGSARRAGGFNQQNDFRNQATAVWPNALAEGCFMALAGK